MKILRRLTSLLLVSGSLLGSAAHALPSGATVVNGNVRVQNSGNTQTITQTSNRAIINWNGFNIDVGELVHFVQPSSISAILNRVVGQDPSVILGAMRSNGQVFLINPNGIVFGDSARIDVGSLVASTLNISDQDFLAGKLRFRQDPGKPLASVINHGTIKIDDHGFLVLTGPMVANEGVILARVGQVALAGGTRSTVSFDPTGMIQVALPPGSSGDDGIVSLSRSATSDLLAGVVTHSTAPAGRMVTRNGRTFLEVESGTVVNTGVIRAEGKDNQSGGRIILDATENTLLAAGSVTSAAGRGLNSDGGEVLLLSDGQGRSDDGSLIDVHGTRGGDGGFVEHSEQYGRVGATVNLRSEGGGRHGELLIDPERILVERGDGAGAPAPPNTVLVPQNTLQSMVGTANLTTEDGVDFEPLVGGALTMQPGASLLINLTVPGGDGTDAITFAQPGDRIVLLAGGTFTLNNGTGNDVRDLYVSSEGDITLNLGGGRLVGASRFDSGPNGDVIRLNNGDAGTAANPIEMEGHLVMSNAGEVFINTPTSLGLAGDFDTFSATGVNLATDGLLQGDSFTANLTGNISDQATTGRIAAADVDITAAMIGTGAGFEFEIDAERITLDGSYIDVNARPQDYVLESLDVTNMAAGISQIERGAGPFEPYLFDNGASATLGDAGVAVSLTTTGDRSLSYYPDADEVSLTTTGQVTSTVNVSLDSLTISGLTLDLNAAGGVSVGNLDLTATGGPINYSGVIGNLTTNSAGVTSITTNSPNLTVDSVAGSALLITNTGGDMTVTRAQAGPLVSLQTSGALVGSSASANNVDLSGASVDFQGIDSPLVSVDSTAGDTRLGLIGASSGLRIISAGDATVSGTDDLDIDQIVANNASVSTTGDITALGAGAIVADTVSLTGDNITAFTTAPTLTVNGSGDVSLVSLSGGDVSLNASSAGGDFVLSNPEGAVLTAGVTAENLSIDALGDILGTGPLIATGITLTGTSVAVSTQGRVLVIDASGNVTITNTVVDVTSLSIDAGGSVNFGTSGNLAIEHVAGGPLARLTAGGNISQTSTAAYVGAADVVLSAGGTITPDLDAPLEVRATNSLSVTALSAGVLPQAPGLVAAALEGPLAVSAVTVGPNSGPTFYNGQLLNPAPPTPNPPTPNPPTPNPPTPNPPTPNVPGIPELPGGAAEALPELGAVKNQLGQQAGQVIDDGSVGSAANDSLVEQSPTASLVARLTEAAAQGNLDTEFLVTLEIDELGQVQVTMSELSPLDLRIDQAEDLRADDLLDLEPDEMGEVGVSLYYDAARDQIVMAVDLRADKVLDLDVSELQEIPVHLRYRFLSDPKIIAEALRADDIIDLEVEDLGEIPIRLLLETGAVGDGGMERDAAKQ